MSNSNIHRFVIDEDMTKKIDKNSEKDFVDFQKNQVYSGHHLYYTGGYKDGAKFALENQWHVENFDRPKESGVYLCCNLNHSCHLEYPFTCFFDIDEFSWYIMIGTTKIYQEVTHWMHIPHVKDWDYPSKF